MNYRELLKRAEEQYDSMQEEMVYDLERLVRIDSTAGEPAENAPYGTGSAEALMLATEIYEGYGFTVRNDDNRYGYVDFGNANRQQIGIFNHLDVVPAGEIQSWQVPPFQLTRQGEFLYGRGTRDNKGSFVAMQSVLRLLRDLRVPLSISIRHYFGCNEENGMDDLDHYLDRYAAPSLSLVPDGMWPVSYTEMGNYMFHAVKENIDFPGWIRAGSGRGIIPDYAEACVEGKRIIASGIARHVAFPEGSVNAIKVLLDQILSEGLLSVSKGKDEIVFIRSTLEDYYGMSLGIPINDEKYGRLRHTACSMLIENGRADIFYNIRYPAIADVKYMIGVLERSFAKHGFLLCDTFHSPGVISSIDEELLRKMADISERRTGCERSPFVMAGGTYARKLPSAAAFGIGTAGKNIPDGIGRGEGHQPDECISLSMLKDSVMIYFETILELNADDRFI